MASSPAPGGGPAWRRRPAGPGAAQRGPGVEEEVPPHPSRSIGRRRFALVPDPVEHGLGLPPSPSRSRTRWQPSPPQHVVGEARRAPPGRRRSSAPPPGRSRARARRPGGGRRRRRGWEGTRTCPSARAPPGPLSHPGGGHRRRRRAGRRCRRAPVGGRKSRAGSGGPPVHVVQAAEHRPGPDGSTCGRGARHGRLQAQAPVGVLRVVVRHVLGAGVRVDRAGRRSPAFVRPGPGRVISLRGCASNAAPDPLEQPSRWPSAGRFHITAGVQPPDGPAGALGALASAVVVESGRDGAAGRAGTHPTRRLRRLRAPPKPGRAARRHTAAPSSPPPGRSGGRAAPPAPAP